MKTETCLKPRSKLTMYVHSTVLCLHLVLKQSKACATFNIIFAVAFETFALGGGVGVEF